MTDGLVSISGKGLTARINPHGAELWSLTDANGAEYMTDADPAFWTGHAPLLFPIIGSVAGDHLRIDGREYAQPRHGFARTSRFTPVERSDDRIVFRLTDSVETRANYPFLFELDMAFRIDGMTLAMQATVRNTGNACLPFSFGYHPAFAWPLPGGAVKGAHKLVFEQDEPQAVRRLREETGLLLAEPEATPVEGRELPLRKELFTANAVIWDRLSSQSLSYGADGGAWLDIAFPDTPSLGLWQKVGARYICIEPWQGHADPEGFAGDFREKPGVVLLDPGQTRSFRMDVTVRPR